MDQMQALYFSMTHVQALPYERLMRGLIEYRLALSLLVRNVPSTHAEGLKDLLAEAVQVMERDLLRREKP